jgi:RNA polymerase sigma-70 factor (ECF subfamily)
MPDGPDPSQVLAEATSATLSGVVNPLSDEDAMKLYQSGNEKGFDLLYEKYRRKILVFHKIHLGSHADLRAADEVQETFRSVVKNRHQFDPQRGSFAAWLYAIAAHQHRRIFSQLACYLRFTATMRNRRVSLRPLFDQRIAFQEALATLSTAQRDVIVLEAQGLTTTEISQALVIPEGTVSSRKHLAVKKLRSILKPKG